MRPLRRHRDFLAWLMSVAVTCNIILAMVCCAPINPSHAGGFADGDGLASVLCTTGGLKSLAGGEQPAGHNQLHSDCLQCSHAPGGSHVPPPLSAASVLIFLDGTEPATFAPEPPLAASYFAFADPTSRGPPRA